MYSFNILVSVCTSNPGMPPRFLPCTANEGGVPNNNRTNRSGDIVCQVIGVVHYIFSKSKTKLNKMHTNFADY